MIFRKILNRIRKADLELINDYRNELRSKGAEIEKLKIAIGRLHGKMDQYNTDANRKLQEYEFQVYSQWGDDGIIQFLVNYLDIADKKFVEFGVESYVECNTRFLLVNNNWTGLVMDGSEANVSKISNDEICWKYDLTAKCAFITAENIDTLLAENKFTGEIGLLHVDIDGNDYWIWKTIQVVNPVIVIMEYNSLFGFDNPWTIPYKKDFTRTGAHFSNLYYGTSLLSLCDLAEKKGYSFIGCNSNGNNAYFVRNDKMKELRRLSPAEGYVLSKFSESRDQSGNLTYLRAGNRLNVVSGMPVWNTRTEQIERIP